MELYAEVRRSVYVEGLSERAAARRFGLARETVRKMLRYSAPPGYRRAQRWTPKFGQLAKVGSRPRRRSLACHGRDGVIRLS